MSKADEFVGALLTITEGEVLMQARQYPMFDQSTGLYQHIMGGHKQWSKHVVRHLAVLDAMGWEREDRKTIGVKSYEFALNKSVYVPTASSHAYTKEEHDWMVVRLKPRNKKFRWAVLTRCSPTFKWPMTEWDWKTMQMRQHPRSEERTWRVIRASQSGKIRLFQTPANAIIAAQQEMDRRYAAFAAGGFKRKAA